MAQLTQARVKALFNYNEETGDLIWRFRPRSDFKTDRAWNVTNTQRAGKPATATMKAGKKIYRIVRVDDVLYLQHRLIWLYVHGEWPENLVDHWDGDGENNRLKNLRDADSVLNQANRAYQGKTKSGLKGAYWHKGAQRWTSRIGVRGKYLHLGLFDTAEEAHSAYVEAAQEHHGEYARAV